MMVIIILKTNRSCGTKRIHFSWVSEKGKSKNFHQEKEMKD